MLTKLDKSGHATRKMTMLMGLGALTLVAACNTTTRQGNLDSGWLDMRPHRAATPISVKEDHQSMLIPVTRYETDLTSTTRDSIAEYAYSARKQGAHLYLLTPIGTQSDDHALKVTEQVYTELLNIGLDETNVSLEPYQATKQNAAVKLVRVGLKAHAAYCPNPVLPNNRLHMKSPPSTLGCASDANLAAMIANPRDLIHPRAQTSADGNHRSEGLKKYYENIGKIQSEMANTGSLSGITGEQ